jgi:hypothetical protein
MSFDTWKDKVSGFKTIDVRGIQGNFFQGLKKQAMALPEGEGLEVVQSFDPIPLYEVMEGLGFDHFTEQKGEAEFHAYFYCDSTLRLIGHVCKKHRHVMTGVAAVFSERTKPPSAV